MTAANSPTLVKDLQKQVKLLTDDLRTRSDDPTDVWGQELKTEYLTATERGRTGLSWSEWRDGEVDLAAVAWVLATVFIRFCEDNDLIDGPWITGEGPRHGQAADNETAYYQAEPSRNARDWLRAGFEALASLPAGRSLLDKHNLVWRAPISADAAQRLLAFWRTQNAEGSLTHDFADPELDTRFLGDLYQDLSDFAKKKYALLQTPVFVEEFILDRTLTPAIAEFGLDGLKLIDPTCGSGHFLLGAFSRLVAEWERTSPGMDPRVRVQKALDSIHGVDINPFAVAIARFRLTVMALKASGIWTLGDAPSFDYHLATGDALLYGFAGVQGDLLQATRSDEFRYLNEDVAEYPHILDRGRYHVVVGNPPYPTVKDKALNEAYRKSYPTCKGTYALSVPFMELFFALSTREGEVTPAGWVGQITSNSFMKRGFGRRLVNDFLSGKDALPYSNPVDLTYVVDTSGAYIPGHGTPTVILVGRHRRPSGATVRAALGVRNEPVQPRNPDEGLVWQEIVGHIDVGSFLGDYVTVTDLERLALSVHPWSLTGGSASDVQAVIEGSSTRTAASLASVFGYTGQTNADSVFMAPDKAFSRRGVEARLHRPYVIGELVRDYGIGRGDDVLFPYEDAQLVLPDDCPGLKRWMWPCRTVTWNRATFGKSTYRQEGRTWWEWHQVSPTRVGPVSLTYPNVATHLHFAIDREARVFNPHAPFIQVGHDQSPDVLLDLLGLLNSSSACFWMKQVSHNKGRPGAESTGADEPWEQRYEFTGTKLQEFPLPAELPARRARILDGLAQQVQRHLPASVLREEAASRSLSDANSEWKRLRGLMIFQQEELDWEVYRLYGLLDQDLTYEGEPFPVAPGERAFAIQLARNVDSGVTETTWFSHHNHQFQPVLDIPGGWPDSYRQLVQRRLDVMASNDLVGLLERPEFKRRWASESWEKMLASALRDHVLDRIEDPALWTDEAGPCLLSAAQLADRLRMHEDLVECVRMLRGAVDVDLTSELGKLLSEEAVPYLASLRFKDSGLRKRAEWESVWTLQRREDAGDGVQIPIPPLYGSADFSKVAYWKARGKLDVPKERFISYPGAGRAGDASMVIGWGGWDHLEQSRALARLFMDRVAMESWEADQLLPILAGLVELEPWLHQWHNDPDQLFNGSPAAFMRNFIDDQLAAMGKTRDDCKAWRP